MNRILTIKSCLAVIVLMLASIFFCCPQSVAGEVPMKRLNDFAKHMQKLSEDGVGYPVNQDTTLKDFYEWYLSSGLYEVSMNNVGDPQKDSIYAMNTHEFEREVVDFFAPLFGFSKSNVWGIVTTSGTDGNAHGMYFGAKKLFEQTKIKPICYVSEEAHYSIRRLADVQDLEVRLIKADIAGKMIPSELEKEIDPAKPALIVIAMGTTFKGAIDDQAAINAVIKKTKPIAVYRHVDAALFGGYLPFTKNKDLVDRRINHFDSIAVSGHKFFGSDEPMGIFLTTKDLMSKEVRFNVDYLNQAVPTITCSRNALLPLKFWWKIKKEGAPVFKAEAAGMLANAEYLESELKKINWPTWRGEFSNTVYFKRPSKHIMKKYGLAPEYDAELGGDLAHVIVMQHVSREVIDRIVADMKAKN